MGGGGEGDPRWAHYSPGTGTEEGPRRQEPRGSDPSAAEGSMLVTSLTHWSGSHQRFPRFGPRPSEQLCQGRMPAPKRAKSPMQSHHCISHGKPAVGLTPRCSPHADVQREPQEIWFPEKPPNKEAVAPPPPTAPWPQAARGRWRLSSASPRAALTPGVPKTLRPVGAAARCGHQVHHSPWGRGVPLTTLPGFSCSGHPGTCLGLGAAGTGRPG